jgi:hypothetical protein
MLFRIRTCIFILMCIITAGTFVTVWEGDDIMAMTESRKGMNRIIPPIDPSAPAQTETATFALG